MPRTSSRPGFLFIELLISMGIIGIIAVVTTVAVNPRKHLCQTQNSRKLLLAREFMHAMQQYEINTNHKVVERYGMMPSTPATAMPICRYGITDEASCLNVDPLVPLYIVDLPMNPDEPNELYTGFRLYQTDDELDWVIPSAMPDCSNL